MIIIKVIPNANEFGIAFKEGNAIVRLRAAPERNAANKELLRELKKIVEADVHLLSGSRSRKKAISFPELTDEEAMMRLKMFAGVAEPGQMRRVEVSVP